MDLVAAGQHRRLHRLTFDIGAVETADVEDLEFAVFISELGVPTADGDVVEEDVVARMPPSGCDGLIQQEPRSGVGAALHDKQRRAARQPKTASLMACSSNVWRDDLIAIHNCGSGQRRQAMR